MPAPAMSPRLFRVMGSDFWNDEVMLAPQTHTDARLADVARLGFDGVWIHAELRQLAPTALFAKHEPDARERVDALRGVVERAKRHGLGIWLYLCEPRGYPMDHPFWQEHPELRGEPFERGTHVGWRFGVHKRAPSYAMCLSTEPVRQFLRDASRQLFGDVPDLAGVTVITASEFHTHCYSRVQPLDKPLTQCKRCAGRPRWEMPVEVGGALADGLTGSGSEAQINFWTWAWSDIIEAAPSPTVFEHLPREISVTSVFEGGVDIVRNGKPARADEYSFAVTGPSERFRQHAEICHRQGRGIWPKFQVTVTHELASMPNLPVPGCLHDKISAARQLGCTGALAIWTMGVAANLNSFAAGQLLAHAGELPPRDQWLRWLARTYFGETALSDASVDALVRAWDGFGRAMQHHPMETNFLYFSPVNYAPAYPWTLKRVGTRMARSWMPEPWGDKLEMSCDRLNLEDVAVTLNLLGGIL